MEFTVLYYPCIVAFKANISLIQCTNSFDLNSLLSFAMRGVSTSSYDAMFKTLAKGFGQHA